MRGLLETTVALVLALPLGLESADAKLGTCETSVGAWEFASQAGGRAVVAKEGSKYQVLWITKLVNLDTGATEAEGGAAECTCDKAPGVLVWKCHIAFSLRPNQIGADERYEWAVDGANLRSFLVGPDGKRNEGIAFRRPK